MPDHTTAAPPSVRGFLFGDAAGEAVQQLAGSLADTHAGRTAINSTRHLSRSAARAVDEEVGAVAADLLDIDLGDALVLSWRRYSALVEAARRTLAPPGSKEIVELATHRVTSEFRPSIDLMLDGIRVNTFEFHLALAFDLTGVSAVVQGGELVGVRGGDCLVTATLTLEGARLAGVSRPVDVAVVLPLARPVRLAGPGARSVPRQRAGVDS